jgi:hypothetical protein
MNSNQSMLQTIRLVSAEQDVNQEDAIHILMNRLEYELFLRSGDEEVTGEQFLAAGLQADENILVRASLFDLVARTPRPWRTARWSPGGAPGGTDGAGEQVDPAS